jgi:GNAT superfamily N-acetyltransferase
MPDPVIRRASAADADAVADVFIRSFHAAMPTIRLTHADEEVRDWFATVVVPDTSRETWVAVASDASITGMMVLGTDMLEHLYLLPEARGAGLGDRLIEAAKARRPAGLDLYAFQVNLPARRFYQRHGFRAVEFGDGSGNQEHEPDVRYAWRP